MISNIWETAASLAQMFIWTRFITAFFGYKYGRVKGRIGFAAVWLTVFAEITFINNLVLYDGLITGLLVITYIIYARLFLKGELYSHICIVLFSTAILFSVGSAVIFVISFISKLAVAELISQFSIWRILIFCLSRALEFLIYSWILHITEDYKLSRKEWILLTGMSFMTWAAITIMTNTTLKYDGALNYMMYLMIIIIVINIMIHYFMLKINRDAKIKTELEMLKMQYNNIKTTEKNMKVLYDNVYSVKHDLEKHFVTIRTMAEANKDNDVCVYIDNVYNARLNSVQKMVFTDNDVFNAIMNIRLEICRQKNIVVSINASNEAVCSIGMEDISVIFGNLFDNAIEAAQKSEKKLILLKIQLQGDYISIYMENSFDKRYSNIDLKTTKADTQEHGFGIKNIRKIVDERNGMIEFFENDDSMFCCDILLRNLKNQH